MHNRLILLERQRQGALLKLRKDATRWIERNRSTEDNLAQLSNISPQLLGCFLSGKRGLSSDTYSRLASIVRNEESEETTYDNPATIKHAQEFGKPAKGDGRIDMELTRKNHNSQLRELQTNTYRS